MNNNFNEIIDKYTKRLCRYKMIILNNFDENKKKKVINKFEKMFYGKIVIKKDEDDNTYQIGNKKFLWHDFIDDITNGLMPKFRKLKLIFELDCEGDVLYICFLSPTQYFCIDMVYKNDNIITNILTNNLI